MYSKTLESEKKYSYIFLLFQEALSFMPLIFFLIPLWKDFFLSSQLCFVNLVNQKAAAQDTFL